MSIPVSSLLIQGWATLLRSGDKCPSVESPGPDARVSVVRPLQQILLRHRLIQLRVRPPGLQTRTLGGHLGHAAEKERVLVFFATILPVLAVKVFIEASLDIVTSSSGPGPVKVESGSSHSQISKDL